ncbi:MAG: ferritin-like domain-containing protein, partial [Rhodothermales bacterium]
MTTDRQTLIDGLNDDLAHEYQAVLMYTSYAALVSGIHRPMLKGFFEMEIPEEL